MPRKQFASERLSKVITRILADPEVKKRHVAGLKLAMNQPEVKERLRQVAIAQWSSPGFRQKHAEATRNAVNQPEVKAKVSASSKAMWADPEFKAKRKEQMNEEAYKEKRRQLQSGRVHVTDGTVNRMVSKTEAETLTATQGWRYGWVPKKP